MIFFMRLHSIEDPAVVVRKECIQCSWTSVPGLTWLAYWRPIDSAWSWSFGWGEIEDEMRTLSTIGNPLQWDRMITTSFYVFLFSFSPTIYFDWRNYWFRCRAYATGLSSLLQFHDNFSYHPPIVSDRKPLLSNNHRVGTMQIFVKTLTGKSMQLSTCSFKSCDVMCIIC